MSEQQTPENIWGEALAMSGWGEDSGQWGLLAQLPKTVLPLRPPSARRAVEDVPLPGDPMPVQESRCLLCGHRGLQIDQGGYCNALFPDPEFGYGRVCECRCKFGA